MSDASKAAIRRLRSGLVPSWELARLSVGCEVIHALAERALLSLLDGEHVFPTFVLGEWGSGKSHLLSYVHALSATTGIATATIDLNARDAALSHPQRLLPIIARTLRVEGRSGLREIIVGVLEDRIGNERLRAFAMTDSASELASALNAIAEIQGREQGLEFLNHPGWRILYGLDLCWSDHASKREKALRRIEALAALFRSIGMGGLVLILDEAETIDQLWNVRSRSTAYGVLGRLLQSRSIWCVLGTTARFDRVIKDDLAGMAGRNDALPFFETWRRRDEGLAVPPSIDERNGYVLAERVCALYGSAYGEVADAPRLVDRSLAEWSQNPVRNPRRLLRLLVSELDRQRAL